MRIGIFGCRASGEKLAKQLNAIKVSADFISDGLRRDLTVLFRLRNYDIIHGLYMRPAVFLSLLFGKMLGKIVIIHWMGTEVMRALTETRIRLMALALNNFVDLNIVFSENLQQDLKRVGIDSVVWPIPVDTEYFSIDKLPPMPKRFSVLCKVADDQLYGGWLYGSDVILRLAKDLPSVQFLVVPGEDSEPSWLLSKKDEAPNLVFLGWKDDMLEVYKQTTVLLRLTRYDGLSYMVIESLALGRQVIWSCNYLPFCHRAKNFDEAKQVILETQKNPRLNVEGAQYVRANFSSKHIMRKLITIYNKLASRKYEALPMKRN